MDVDVHGCGQEKGFKLKRQIMLSARKFPFPLTPGTGISAEIVYVRHSWIY